MCAEHTTMMSIAQMSITFLHSICLIRPGFHMLKRQKTVMLTLFCLKSDRKAGDDESKKQGKGKQFFPLLLLTRGSCLKNYLKGEAQFLL